MPVEIAVTLPDPPEGASAGQWYSRQGRLPVVWMLHGGDSDCHDFEHRASLMRILDRFQVMTVCPSALNSDYADHPEFADGYLFETFFFQELMPMIQADFPADSRPEQNFLTGYSMGAAGAWMYGLAHPGSFGMIAPIASGLKDYRYLEPWRPLSGAEFRALAEQDPKKFPAGYGAPGSPIHRKEINMVAKYATVGDFLDSREHTWDRFAEAAAGHALPKAYLPCSRTDRMYGGVRKLQELAEQLHSDSIVFDIRDSGEGYEFAESVLPDIMIHFGLREKD